MELGRNGREIDAFPTTPPTKRGILGAPRHGASGAVARSYFSVTFHRNDNFRFSLKFSAKVRLYVVLTWSLFPARFRANAFTPRPVDKEKKKMKYRVYVRETSNLSFAENGVDAERCLSLLPCHKSFRKQSLFTHSRFYYGNVS